MTLAHKMDTAQIYECLKYVAGDTFVGVYPSDMLPTISEYPAALVCNTDPHNKPGQHWIAMYIDVDGYGEYFDSYGMPPLVPAFGTFLTHTTSTWIYNSRRLQSNYSTVCGQYCIYYLVYRTKGIPMNTLIRNFTNDLYFNDETVNSFVALNFNINPVVFDMNFVCKQKSCKML